jgi:hypothetical protein
MRVSVADVRKATFGKPDGYFEAILERSQVNGDWLEIADTDLTELRARYYPPAPPLARVSMAPPPPARPPSLPAMAVGLFKAVTDEIHAAAAGEPRVAPEEAARRLGVCAGCSDFLAASQQCARCGCYMPLKSTMRSQRCPVDKW